MIDPTFRAAIGVALGVGFTISGVGVIVCGLRAERHPASEVARRVIEQENELDAHAYIDDSLLSEQGLALRRQSSRFARAAGIIAILIVLWTMFLT